MLELVTGIFRLCHTRHERDQAREAFFRVLRQNISYKVTVQLVSGIVKLCHEQHEIDQARETMISLLCQGIGAGAYFRLMIGISDLTPTIDDLTTWQRWRCPPSRSMIRTVRKNTPFSEWRTALPSLAALTR